MSALKPPLIVFGALLAVVGAFYLGGPGTGLAAGALAALAIVVVAARERPRRGIGTAAGADVPRRLLVVVTRPIEDPRSAASIVAEAGGPVGSAEVMVLAPARIGFLDRWASDLEGARQAAQRTLVLSVATLAAAGIEAEARVGDEDVVQAIEDQVGSFAATEVVLVTASDGEDPAAAAAADELAGRLRTGFRRLQVSGRGAH